MIGKVKIDGDSSDLYCNKEIYVSLNCHHMNVLYVFIYCIVNKKIFK